MKITWYVSILCCNPFLNFSDSEKVSIIWNDNHMSEYTLEWLKKYAYDNDSISNVVRKQRSTVFPWCSKTIPGGTVPVLQYKDIISNDKGNSFHFNLK